MSDVIRLLPDHVANQIAAGEVVQRPASVVKELLENAIDAKATSIKLIIKEAGRQLIQVIDNGKGMSVTDARMAFERHATSKIASTEDIFQIQTKGFRGEALASIAAVAQVELKTKQETDDVGTLIRMHGGQVKSQEPTVTPVGTMISVSNLFYNVPARRNFLKSNQVEFRHITDEFQRVALAHEDISFQLIHNDNEIFRLNATHLAQRILHIFGKKLEGQLVPVNEETDVVKISGFIGKPQIAKKSRGEQFFFANHRFIKSGYLHKALQSAYENLIVSGEHPSYFIFFELNPEKIDINIHPTKTEIKFEDDAAIYAQLRASAKHALGQYQVTPTLDFEQPEWDIPILKKETPIKSPEITVDQNYNPFKTENSGFKPSTPSFSPSKAPKIGGSYNYYELEQETEPTQEILIDSQINPVAKDVMQWQNAYLITSFMGDILIIDQHRAHQTVLFEHLKNKNQQNTLSQQLLFPVEIDLNTNEVELIQNSEHHWISLGFDFELDTDKLSVKAIPADLKTEMILPLITDFLSAQPEEVELERSLIKFMAKTAAIKKGTSMNIEEAQHLVQQLFELDQFNYSPFGKRIYKSFSLQEMSKLLD